MSLTENYPYHFLKDPYRARPSHYHHNQHHHHRNHRTNVDDDDASRSMPSTMHKSLESSRQSGAKAAEAKPNNRIRTIIAGHFGAERQRDVKATPSVRNIDWQPSQWVNQLAMDRFFHLDDAGAVRVRKSGLYQVYAQITFEKRSKANGFIVVHNADRFLECQTSTQSSNSCYTSRVVYMQSNDQIRLTDMFAEQRVVLHEGQSFFGLMKLGQVPQQEYKWLMDTWSLSAVQILILTQLKWFKLNSNR